MSTTVRPYLVLAICCMSLLMVSMDVTIVNVALPSIRHDLDASTAGLQWVLDGYTVVLASLLMLSGSVADRVGRRRTFQTGLALFTISSALCGLAPSLGALIAFRVLQGIGASMLNPVAMSIITNTFVEPRARARAIGVWGAVVGVSMALGPLVGGGLTQTIGWRAIFAINLPIGAIAIALAQKFVPESRAPRARRPDPLAQVLVLATLAAVTYGVIAGPHAGFADPEILALFAGSAVALVVLVWHEHRRAEPLIDPRFFRSAPFASATVIAVVMFGTFSGFLFLNALYLQEVRGLSPFVTGLYTLPLAAMTIVTSPLSGMLVGAYGPRRSLVIAGLAIAAATAMLSQLETDSSLGWLIGSYVVFGIGFGMVNAPITNSAVSGMPRAQAGVASAIASTSRQVGASLGVAIGGAIATGGGGGAAFAASTHPFWWLASGGGVAVAALGLLATSSWGERTRRDMAALIAEGDAA